MKKLFTILMAGIALLSYELSAQTAGTLDPTFNGTGKVIYDKDNVDLYQDVKVQTDGKIITVGTSYTPSWSSSIEVTRYLSDGSFDPSFGVGGHYNYTANIESGAYKCLIRPNGKILLGGYTTDYSTWWMLLIQLNDDGTADTAFGNNGIVNLNFGQGEEIIYALALFNNGDFLAAGYSQNSDYRNVPVVLKFTENGTLITTFGTNGVASVPVTEIDNDFSAVGVQSDGKIIAAGHISNGLSWFSLLVARFNENGQLDPSYATNGIINLNLGNVDDEFYDLVVTPDDQTILTGFTVSQGDFYYHMLLMKFDNGGWPSISFGLSGYNVVGELPYTFGDAMVLQPDGKILVSGSTGQLTPSNNDWALWRFTDNGFPDPDFGTNGLVTTEFFGNPDEALGVAIHQNKIIVAGKTRNASNMLDFAVARYQNDLNVNVEELKNASTFSIAPNPVKRNGTLNLKYKLNQSEDIVIEVVNVIGNTIMTIPLSDQNAGDQSYQLNLDPFISAGVYTIKMQSSMQFESFKIVVTD